MKTDNQPQVGAAIVFPPGVQSADATYGHVAVIIGVDTAENTVTISEANASSIPGWSGAVVNNRVIKNAGSFCYVH